MALQLETEVSDSHRKWGSSWQTGLNKVALLFYIPCTTSTGEECAFSKPSYTEWSQDCVLLARGHTHNPTCLLSPPHIHGKSFTYVQSLPSSLQLVGPNGFILTKKLQASLADVLTPIRMDLQPLQVPFPEFLFASSLIMHLSFSAPGWSPPSYQLPLKPSEVSHQPCLWECGTLSALQKLTIEEPK